MVPETRLRKTSWQKCDLKAPSWRQGLVPWVRGQCSRPRLFLRRPLPASEPCAGQLQGPDKKVQKSQADVQSRALNCDGATGTCDGEGQACPESCGRKTNQSNHRNTILTEWKTMNPKILQLMKRLPG